MKCSTVEHLTFTR